MTERPADETNEGQPGSDDPTVHVVVWAQSSQARADVEAWLTQRGFDPRIQWTTPNSLSYRLNTTDTNAVDEVLQARSDLSWTVVAPGQADYVLRQLYVQAPDGRSFRITDVPSATPIDAVTRELLIQYPDRPGTDRPTIVDHVESSGVGRRTDPDATLADEGIRDGDRLRVGYMTTAG